MAGNRCRKDDTSRRGTCLAARPRRGGVPNNVVIVLHFAGSVKDYAEAVPFLGHTFPIPARCPHPDCQATGSLIGWGIYLRWACETVIVHRIRVQRLRCKVCGRTHSLLPDFLHPFRHYVVSLLQRVVSLYLLGGLSWEHLLRQLPESGPARSTVREWLDSFAYGAGELLLDVLTQHLLTLEPLADLPDTVPGHLRRVTNPVRRRRLARAYRFWLLAERLYAQVKVRQPRLHFAADQLFTFLLHWLPSQGLPPRLFWSPVLPHTPTAPFQARPPSPSRPSSNVAAPPRPPGAGAGGRPPTQIRTTQAGGRLLY